MADLTGKTLANGYPNLVTIGATTNDNPTSGTLENGKGNNLTSVTFDGAVVVNESGGNNDFRVEGDTDANLIFADASADYVAIGETNPISKLHVNSGAIDLVSVFESTDANALIALIDSNTTNSTQVRIGAQGDELRLIAGGSESVRIDANGDVGIGTTTPAKELDVNGEIRASGGILFGSDTAAANTLDDYEEGTWTPVYSPQTGSFTTMTMDVISATYTKIGRQVTVIANIRTDNVDATGASGNLQIGGLPFIPGSLGFSAISIGRSVAFVNAPDSGVISNNSSKIFLRKNNTDSSSVVGDLTTGAIADRNNLELTAIYFTS